LVKRRTENNEFLFKKKERKEIKENCVQHTKKGFGQQQVSFGAIGVHLSTSYILFPFFVHLILYIQQLRLVFLDYYSVLHHYIFQRIPLTYYPTKLHLKRTVSCCTVVAVTITLPLQIAALVLALFRERKNLFCKW
jgi:hypothetical protein